MRRSTGSSRRSRMPAAPTFTAVRSRRSAQPSGRRRSRRRSAGSRRGARSGELRDRRRPVRPPRRGARPRGAQRGSSGHERPRAGRRHAAPRPHGVRGARRRGRAAARRTRRQRVRQARRRGAKARAVPRQRPGGLAVGRRVHSARRHSLPARLREPMLRAPGSLGAQLRWIREHWPAIGRDPRSPAASTSRSTSSPRKREPSS